MRSAECGVEMEGRSSNDARPDIPHSTFRIPHSGRGGGGGVKIAVVFDTLHPEWDDAAYKKELEAKVEEAEYEVARALMAKGHDVLEDASIGIAQASVVENDDDLAERVKFIHEKFQQAAIVEE